MKRNPFSTLATALAVLALATALFVGGSPPVAHAEFSRLVSIPGGTPAQRLSVSLSNAGYTGPTALDELTLCTPDANANSMYIGSSSSVSASTGFELAPGVCITYRAAGRPIEASSIYIFTSVTADAAVSLRQR